MFENLDPKNGQNLSGNNAASSQGAAKGASAPKIEDMFADVKDVAAPTVKSRGAAPVMPKTSSAKPTGYSSNVLRNLIIIVIVLLILLAGVFLAARFVGSAGLKNLGEQFSNLKGLVIKENKPGTTIVVNNEKPAVQEGATNNEQTAIAPVENVAPVSNVPVENISTNTPENIPAATSTATSPEVPVSAIDTDGDGLTDTEEATLKTNPLKADSDEDGLTDFQEVKTYLTDPNKADTDGDSYLDGAEVKSGYNPNGPGKMPPQ